LIGYVGGRQAPEKFKTSATSVPAPERFKAMLATRREWAEVEGLSPDAIEKLYSGLENHFIAEEMKHWVTDQSWCWVATRTWRLIACRRF
jgi:isochorismate pyruvate lyase